jgi:hypothetical protein
VAGKSKAATTTVARAADTPTKTVDSPSKVTDTPRETTKPAAAGRRASPKAAAAAGPYWVQVGAFRDPEAAKRLVGQLREQGFPAEQSTTAKAGQPAAVAAPPPPESRGDRYHVVVSGASAADVDAKLATKGMTSETTPGGVVVQPSLPLREAVALSRELADAGLAVQVRRLGGPAPSAPSAPVAPVAGDKETWHRVRVGGFPDRAAAMTAVKQLEARGFKPFVARPNE